MKKMQLSSKLSLLMTMGLMAAQVVHADPKNSRVIYGEDNRIETFEASAQFQKLAKSTAGMIRTVKTISVDKHTMLPPYTLSHDMNLCEGEKFADQPSAVSCSGFLVGPDLLVTAGHCITTQNDCDEVSWVFDYKVKDKNGKTDVLVKNENVYKCSKVLEAKLYSDKNSKIDYSLVRLERVVKDREPLKFRTSGKIDLKADITVIGHPSGLPQKVASGAQVLENSTEHFFKTNLDTFGGNSGSAVFNDKTGEVEGILVRGAKDYEKKAKCRIVHVTDEEITDFVYYGEAVSRITDIKTLKYRDLYLAAVKVGDIAKVKEFAKELADISITDNEMNNAFHIAAKTNNIEMLKTLIELGVEINAQNLRGDTALHLAIVSKAKLSARFLLANNADTLIVNNANKSARDLTSFFAFKLKSEIKKVELEQKKKKKAKEII